EIELVEVPDYSGWAAMWPKLKVPIIARLHGSLTYFAAELGERVGGTAACLERSSLRRADHWCAVSHYVAEKTQGLLQSPLRSVEILYSIVEPPSQNGHVTRSDRNVLFMGTLTHKKGIASLIDAWPMVLNRCADAKLHVYGKDGRGENGRSMTSMLSSRLSEQQLSTVKFHGHVSREKLHDALRKSRLGVFPSYAETFGLAPAESMAWGCPTIYSERTCGREVVRHGKDGLLIDPDKPEQIANAIIQLLTDDQLAETLGNAGRQRVEQNFSIKALLPRNIDYFQRCIDNHA
ncbi:MAG: glycosyltransferase family 4 protein, partial [Novipirellula sp. JB048]